MNPELTISGVTITLLNRFSIISHECVLYQVRDESGTQKYTAYKSLSEGLWRLAWFKKFERTMTKGDDYITTTQIHMDLQCLFESQYQTLTPVELKDIHPYVSNEEVPEDPERLERLKDAIQSKETYWNAMPGMRRGNRIRKADEVERVGREFVHPAFLPLVALMRPGEGLQRVVYLITHPTPGARTSYTGPDSYWGIYKHPDMFIEEELVNYKASKKNLRKPMDFYFQTMSDMLQSISKTKMDYYVGKTETYHKIVSVISDYMKFFFRTSSEPSAFVCTLMMPIPGSTTTMGLHIYKRSIELIKGGDRFDLYYAVYTIPDEFPSIKGTYKTILNLLPSPSAIGPFGLNKVYLSAGIYVYKLFDYKKQFYRQGAQTFGQYVFLGDLLTNMWPLQAVREGAVTNNSSKGHWSNEVNLSAIGGKRPKRKTRKHRK
jgi:hypothetical protein